MTVPDILASLFPGWTPQEIMRSIDAGFTGIVLYGVAVFHALM